MANFWHQKVLQKKCCQTFWKTVFLAIFANLAHHLAIGYPAFASRGSMRNLELIFLRYWFLFRNNNMATNLQKFTSS